jgi:GntR family transcriptional regulator, transcriptional repressor for pyruvate dehydrogenase complex
MYNYTDVLGYLMAGKKKQNSVLKLQNADSRASADAIKQVAAEQPRYAEIVDQIQQLIENGELGQGDQLISERELAELYRVSRTSIRRALAVLAGRGIIEVSPRKGAVVRRPTARDSMKPWIHGLLKEQNQNSNLAEVRQIVEVQAARLAAERRQESDIQRLWSLHYQVIDQVRDGRPADKADTAFHVGIVETANNSFLTDLIVVLASAMMKEMAPSWSYVLSTSPTEVQRYITEHEQIIQAIVNQDADLASELMSTHIIHASRLLVDDNEKNKPTP